MNRGKIFKSVAAFLGFVLIITGLYGTAFAADRSLTPTQTDQYSQGDPEVTYEGSGEVQEDLSPACTEETPYICKAQDSKSCSLASTVDTAASVSSVKMTKVTLAKKVNVYKTGYYYTASDTKDGTRTLEFKNVPNGVTFTTGNKYTNFYISSCSNTSVLPVTKITLKKNILTFAPIATGKAKVKMILNGKTFTVTVYCYQPSLSRKSMLMMKNEKKDLQVTGVPEEANIKYSSANPEIATVTKDGIVQATGYGNTVIYVKVGNAQLGTVASVTTGRKERAIKRARKIAKNSKYSQAKRMEDGYYDCSSLVYKGYSPEGIYFGSKNWAPTAADMAKYLAGKDKIVCKKKAKNLKAMVYRAGDLLFCEGEENGRYLNIYHVELFRGYLLMGYDDDGEPVLKSRWANLADGYSDSTSSDPGVFGRP